MGFEVSVQASWIMKKSETSTIAVEATASFKASGTRSTNPARSSGSGIAEAQRSRSGATRRLTAK